MPLILRERAGCPGGGKGVLVSENKALTLSITNDQKLVAPVMVNEMFSGRVICDEKAYTLKSFGYRPFCIGNVQLGGINPAEQSRALDCMHDAQIICREDEEQEWTVRRLTPTECARLQGMPDDWTDGVEGYSDTAAYKMWGNGMALPCVLYVMEGIQEQEEKRRS